MIGDTPPLSTAWTKPRRVTVVIPDDAPTPMPGMVGVVPMEMPRAPGETCPLCGEAHAPDRHTIVDLLGLTRNFQARAISAIVVSMGDDCDVPYSVGDTVHMVTLGNDGLQGYLIRDVFFTPSKHFIAYDPA